MFAFASAPIGTCLISLAAFSLGGNNFTFYGEYMSGLLKLVEILPLTKIESLGCAAASKCSLLRQRLLTRFFLWQLGCKPALWDH